MLTDFPKGFGFDPTVMGAQKLGYIGGSRKFSRLSRPTARRTFA